MSSEISIVDGLLMRNKWLIILSVMQNQVLDQIHTGHQGTGKCHERARQSVWWPGLSAELDDIAAKCQSCCMNQARKIEPMIPSPFPELP